MLVRQTLQFVGETIVQPVSVARSKFRVRSVGNDESVRKTTRPTVDNAMQRPCVAMQIKRTE